MLMIGSKHVGGAKNPVYIVAEIGQNHQGCITTAMEMIMEAKKIGCDCVKFQKSWLSAKFTKSALNRVYDGNNSWGNTYGEHKKYLEFTLNQYRELQRFSKAQKIDFTASAMDEVSLIQLYDMEVPFIKIGSGDANNFPMIEKAAVLDSPLVISTGMQTMDTIDKIVEIMRKYNKTNFSLLHCVSSYPSDPIDCKLQLLVKLKQRFPEVVVGYSGHEQGIEITKAAVLLGAKIIERHFTLNKAQKGSDHTCSLLPREFRKLVEDIRTYEKMDMFHNIPLKVIDIKELLANNTDVEMSLSDTKEKVILPCELSCKNKLGKSIVTANSLKKGQQIKCEDICIKVSEPNGISAEFYFEILGKQLKCDLDKDIAIQYSYIDI